MKVRFGLTGVAVLLLVATACSSGGELEAGASSSATASEADGHNGMGMPGDGSYAFGMPGDENAVDRTIEVAQFDDFRFDPTAIEVAVGETIRFDVTNRGIANHEFVLGDAAFQRMHEDEMAEIGAELAPDEPYAIGLEPGTSKSLVWTFTEPVTIEYGCHIPGHYAGGMVGSIEVTEA
jgi:uncharacterized cupredoxin-like copper-binding protein